jgi:hypothetical protein
VLSFNQSRLDKVVDQIRHDGAVGAEVRGERELAERLAIDCCGQHLVAAMAAREITDYRGNGSLRCGIGHHATSAWRRHDAG